MHEQLESNTYYRLCTDNLFTSVKLSRAAMTIDTKVLTLVIARVYRRGISPLVYQLEELNPFKKKEVVGDLKVYF